MHISILTLFPEMFQGPFDHSILKRAQEKNILKIDLVNIRNFAQDKHRTVDDHPYGGGVGMIMKVDVVDRALQNVKCQMPALPARFAESRRAGGSNVKCTERIILLDPGGKTFNQKIARKLSKYDHLILVCGHYEGVDERVRKLVDEEISIGDYVLTGGEIPAMVIVDSVSRLIPGVLTKKEATQLESFSSYTIEYPQYTRPPLYRRWRVPKVLLSGDHTKIEKWRRAVSLKRTQKRRLSLTTQKD